MPTQFADLLSQTQGPGDAAESIRGLCVELCRVSQEKETSLQFRQALHARGDLTKTLMGAPPIWERHGQKLEKGAGRRHRQDCS